MKMQGGGKYSSYAQINAANQTAQRLAAQQGYPFDASQLHVARDIGDPVVQYIDAATGKPSTHAPTPAGQQFLPSGVSSDDVFQNQDKQYGYMNPQYGNWVPVDPGAVYGKYGAKQPSNMAPATMPQFTASRQMGGSAPSEYNDQFGNFIPQMTMEGKAMYDGLPQRRSPNTNPLPDASQYPTHGMLGLAPRISPDVQLPNTGNQPPNNFATYPSTDKRKRGKFTIFDAGLLMRGLSTGLQEISGQVARNRQNQYDYMQQSALGQMNPMPTTDYQPNPYSLYSKYGGSLRNYIQSGGASTRNIGPVPTYRFDQSDGRTPNSGDSADYRTGVQRATIAPAAFDDLYTTPSRSLALQAMDKGDRTTANKWMAQHMNYLNMFMDSQNVMNPQQVHDELSTLTMPADVMKPSKKQDGGSLVDYMKSNYMNSSLGNRKFLFDEMFKEPYKGTAQQNTKILSLFKSGKIPKGEILREASDARTMVPEGEQMKYGGLAHVDYFGPPFSNGAKYQFADEEKFDKRVVKRLFDRVIGKLYRQEGGPIYDQQPEMKSGGNWIQGAVKHPGRCTPGSSNYDCPPGSPQYNLAQTFKKHHGFHKKK